MTGQRLFAYRLALALGIPSVNAMLSGMTSLEFHEWSAFYEKDPWGDQRGDIRSGIIASTMVNLQRDKKSKLFTPQDFMLFTEKQEYQIEESEIERQIETFMSQY